MIKLWSIIMGRWDPENGNKITYLTCRLPEYLNIRYYNEYWICRYYLYNIVSGYSATVVNKVQTGSAHTSESVRAPVTLCPATLSSGNFFFHCRNIIHYYTHMYCYLLLFFHYHLIMTCWSGYYTQNFGSFYRCYYYCYCKL